MGAKQFKRARQLARKISTGQPASGLSARKTAREGRMQAIVTPGTTRAVYHQLKKMLARGLHMWDIETAILAEMAKKTSPMT